MSIQQSINQAATIGTALYTYNKEKKDRIQKEKHSTSSSSEQKKQEAIHVSKSSSSEQKKQEAIHVSNIKSKIENMITDAAERSNAKRAYKTKVFNHSLLAAKKSKTRYEKFINIEGEKNG